MAVFQFAAPARFYSLAGRLIAWFAALAVVLTAIGMYLGFWVAPVDYQQGQAYRIIFIHVPAAWMGMFIYLVMAFWCAVSLIWNTRLSSMMAQALAPTGAMFTFVALWTGAYWGRPTWGTYWVWDARITSTLVLLFLYFGYLALRSAINDPRRADRASALLALVGGQCAHHLLLGALVEHLASRCQRQPYRSPENGRNHVAGDADHGVCLLGLCDCHRLAPGAQHHA